MKNYSGPEKEAYLQGRLLGLNELIKVLKESINEEGSNHGVIQSIVGHISNEMSDILGDLGEVKENKLEEIKEKHAEVKQQVKEIQKTEPKKEEIAKSSLFKENVETADDLMKGLMKVSK
ncbi:hypothetical protein HUU53_02305 [Candidatus Micrarchaeota archaeon]|nr:hypothetical protein [Candidatus Micrarchaeota archaeon]